MRSVMDHGIVTRMRTWRVVTDNDVLKTNYIRSELASADDGKFFGACPYNAVALRAYGQNDSDTASIGTATITVSGWMGNRNFCDQPVNNVGQVIYKGELQCGAITIASGRPIEDFKWPSATWFEAAPDPAPSIDAFGATVIDGGGHAILVIPLGIYRQAFLEVTGLGTGTQMTVLGILAAPCQTEG